MGENSEESVDIPSYIDPKTGARLWRPQLTATTDQREKTLYHKPSAVIPIVFIPGIMGTNLRTRGKNDAVWRPPNTVGGKLSAAFTWIWRGPKTRQGLLDMNAVEVDPTGPIDVGNSGISTAVASARGWGAAMQSSYHPIMALMQKRLNAIAFFSSGAPLKSPTASVTLHDGWKKDGLNDPAEYGERRKSPALTHDELVRAAHYRFDVWCAGYNWLQSNRQSGLDVRDYIENTVLKYYKDSNIPAEKVILVTHSMGGLVSRALTEIHGYDKVLGVVSGVQPATGAPAFYHHARCGYTGLEQVVLGRNAGEVVAVIANAPGALELAPTFDYNSGNPWLTLHDTSTHKKTLLPATKDPYTEIYKNPAWYGLVPQGNSKYLDLSSLGGGGPIASARARFYKTINMVSDFHHDIYHKYNDQTYAHYGADSRRDSWTSIEWVGEVSKMGSEYFDDQNGNYSRTEIIPTPMGAVTSTITGASLRSGEGGSGDSTVPILSGAAPGMAGVKTSFRHGNMGGGTFNKAEGYDHQSSYNDSRAQWATLYSIAKLAQLADWHAQ
ncbi:hypothetical protein CSC70_03150 [Pseudoxanthomonas kalamensis DSM 18571]|uniref:esterase/lipase family protein n=1 Tax=Pseudoxanthomonas kalamensis TaxID=289483 RepID=UPI001390962F|nr:hypothetical protein [Pseudoxanthomonas kalamensis]KAF1712524.1 hypothetical protein CSC70_03150 [Pseudoxanthomonas kalamensis DSM 18571]